MQHTTWEAWNAAQEVPVAELQAGDLILSHPEAGPFGPWEVVKVERGTGHVADRYNVTVDHDVWYGKPADHTYRVSERATP